MSNGQPTQSGSAVFLGPTALLRFTSGEYGNLINEYTIWFLDNETQTLRPFEPGAFEQLRPDLANNPDVMQRTVVTIDPDELSPGGILDGFSLIDDYSYAIRKDGSAKKIDYSTSQIQARYGNEPNEQLESTSAMLIDGFIESLESMDTGIPNNFLNSLKNNTSQLAFYINAMTYGGYSMSDVYKDIKRNSLIEQGYSQYENINPISAKTNKYAYDSTLEGQTATNDSMLVPPSSIGNFDSTLLNLPVYQMPDEAFKTLIPILDYNSDEFKNKMGEVETAYYDVLLQQLSASTEREKALADYAYNEFKKQVSENYGIQLSNNATEAWQQLESLKNTFSSRGIYGSGIQSETVDDYLRNVRKSDQLQRLGKLSTEEEQEARYYYGYATPDQINQLIDADKASGLPREEWKSVKWGLLPSDDILEELSIEKLKEKYPNSSEEDLMRYRSAVLDENNNYRSDLYSRYFTSKQETDQEKTIYKQSKVMERGLNEEEKAYKEFTTPDVAFLRADAEPGSENGSKKKTSKQTSLYDSLVNQINSVPATDRGADTNKRTGSTSPVISAPSTPSSSYTSNNTTPQYSSYTAPQKTSPTSYSFDTNSILKELNSGPVQSTIPQKNSAATGLTTKTTTPSSYSVPKKTYTGFKERENTGGLWGKIKSWFK